MRFEGDRRADLGGKTDRFKGKTEVFKGERSTATACTHRSLGGNREKQRESVKTPHFQHVYMLVSVRHMNPVLVCVGVRVLCEPYALGFRVISACV